MLVFAQSVDPISGGAGWVGAGLLGAVLAWLCFIHLPAKDKQLKDHLTAKDETLKMQEDQSWERLEKMSTVFEATMQRITDHCKEELKTLTEFWRRELDLIKGK